MDVVIGPKKCASLKSSNEKFFVEMALRTKRLPVAVQASVDLAEGKVVHQTKRVLKIVAFSTLVKRVRKPKMYDVYFQNAFSPGENGLIYFRFGENAYLHSMFSKSKTTTNLWARVKNEVT